MKNSMIQSLFKYCLLLLFLSAVVLTACDEENPFLRRPYDFSSVPEAYDTTRAVERLNLGQGLLVYVIEEGENLDQDSVTMNDRVEVFYTGRFTDGEIFDSSYRDGLTRPISNNVTGFIDGFSFGLVGCTPGEKRTIVVPPVYGYQDFTPANNTGRSLRGETLIFDIELVSILK